MKPTVAWQNFRTVLIIGPRNKTFSLAYGTHCAARRPCAFVETFAAGRYSCPIDSRCQAAVGCAHHQASIRTYGRRSYEAPSTRHRSALPSHGWCRRWLI
jgi:hypothetical protein